MITSQTYQIYTLNEPNSDIVRYVGLTSDFKERIRAHFRCNKKYRVNDWIKSVKKKGLLPTVNIIDETEGLEQARIKEIGYIKLFKSLGARLTNLTNGGEGTKGYSPSKETRKKISEKVKGFKHTPEAIKKISEASKRFMTGRKMSQESIDKMAKTLKGRAAWNKGRSWTKEERKKLSEARKEKIKTGDIKVWNKGIKTSQKVWNKGKSKIDFDLLLKMDATKTYKHKELAQFFGVSTNHISITLRKLKNK